jgi:hypothetical protein
VPCYSLIRRSANLQLITIPQYSPTGSDSSASRSLLPLFNSESGCRAEIHGEHLVFLRSDGSFAALFVLEIVESWPEVEP